MSPSVQVSRQQIRGEVKTCADNARARVYASCARVHARIFFCGSSLLFYEPKFKLHKDPIFHCGDICKMILTFVTQLIFVPSLLFCDTFN